MSSLRLQLNEPLEELAKYQAKVAKARKNLAKLEESTDQLKALFTKIKDEESKSSKLQIELEETKKQLRQQQQDKESLEEEITKLKSSLQREGEEKESAARESKSALEQVEELKREIAKLKRDKKNADTKREELQVELDAANKAKERWKHRRTNSEYSQSTDVASSPPSGGGGSSSNLLSPSLETERFKKELEKERATREELECEVEALKKQVEREKEKERERDLYTPSPRFSSSSVAASPRVNSQSSGRLLERTTSTTSFDQLLQPGVRDMIEIQWGDITLGKRITGGGFAEIFEARYFGEPVAVKKLLDQTSGEAKKDLVNEVVLWHGLRSGYVVNLYGACFSPPNLCMVMEFFPKGSLGYLLWDKSISISWDKRWGFVRDAALALNYLHSKHPPVLHRDIKSGNFLVSEDWKLKITDFGCSIPKNAVKKKTEAGSDTKDEDFVGGTINWTAPEVLEGNEYTEMADVYSYSMVLFEIATREVPWKEYSSPREQLQIKKNVCAGRRPILPGDLPPDYKSLMSLCWEQKPDDRSSFKDVLKFLKKKGFMEGIGSHDDAVDRLSEAKGRAEEELEIQKRLKSKAESKAEELEKLVQEEKFKRTQLQNELSEFQTKLESELESKKMVERMKEEQVKRLELKVADLEKRREEMELQWKKEKKKVQKLKKERVEFEAEKEDLEKKLENERKRSTQGRIF